MDPLIGAALVGGAANATSSIFGQRSANRTNIRLARQAREHNLRMWNLSNEYNTPAAQMARLQEAGLNPALMYGQGNTGNAAAPPPAPVASVESVTKNVQLPEILMVMNQLAANKKLLAEAESAKYQAEWMSNKMPWSRKWIQYEYEKSMFDTQRAEAEAGKSLAEHRFKTESFDDLLRAIKGEADIKEASGSVAKTMEPFNLTMNDGIYAKFLTLLAKLFGFKPADIINP